MVWEGRQPGIYDNWADASAQVENFKGAKYKSYASQAQATAAFRSGDGRVSEDLGRLLIHEAEMREKEGRRQEKSPSWKDNPEVDRTAIAVDAACSGNPGPVEYRGVDLSDGHEIFRVGPLAGGTNNIGEYLAIVHALALMQSKGINRPVYSDSLTARSWIRNKKSKSLLKANGKNAEVLELLRRADRWVATHSWPNRIMRWDTDSWGEIPADFGRK